MCEIKDSKVLLALLLNMDLPLSEMGNVPGGSRVKHVNIEISLRRPSGYSLAWNVGERSELQV